MIVGIRHVRPVAWIAFLLSIGLTRMGCRSIVLPPSSLLGEWRTEGGGFHRTGSVHPGLSPPLEEVWRARAGRGIRGSPVPVGSAVIIATTDGKVKAFRIPDGKRIWETKIRGGCFSSPIVSEGRLYLATEYPDGTLYCLELDTGDILWERPIGPSRSTPSIEGGIIFSVTNVGEVFAHSTESGELRWKSAIRSLVPQSPVAAGDSVYILCPGDTLKTLSTSDGTVLERIPLPLLWQNRMVKGNSHLAFSSRLGIGFIASSSSGKIGLTSGSMAIYRFALSGGTILATNGVRTAFAADASTGETLWTHDTSGLLEASPCIAGEIGVIVSLAGEIRLLDMATGLPLWSTQIDAPLSPSPAISGEWLFITTDRGELIAFSSSPDRAQKGTE
ncbi:MAG: hypothetical protein A2Z06_00555 [Candidatus Glassbacteria bacterium RBG_16_58_8]|uniref:Pyrrolo-quinoline quinone repeat domain-containing protein n=1 Tax=Candidatus Glassbacteria bacterium RBG_16_58_8 TaxID=1817866 RepID=A0A1F5YC70_9BACT|nr:MAG: hypothetical protein A2Z06_00555 [Candidatus Glassbacteria bacterium RBG_16_58_8]